MKRLKGEERRNRIIEILSSQAEPVSGKDLAAKLGVSRQVIVTDIALLRTKFPNLVGTVNGYVMFNFYVN